MSDFVANNTGAPIDPTQWGGDLAETIRKLAEEQTNAARQLEFQWTAPNAGWTCPKCGRVFSPLMTQCFSCNSQLLRPAMLPSPWTVIPTLIPNDQTVPIQINPWWATNVAGGALPQGTTVWVGDTTFNPPSANVEVEVRK